MPLKIRVVEHHFFYLTFNGNNSDAIAAVGAIDMILAMKKLSSNSIIQSVGCAALQNLAMSNENFKF